MGRKLNDLGTIPFCSHGQFFLAEVTLFCGWKIPNLPELESSCFKLKHRLLYVSNKKNEEKLRAKGSVCFPVPFLQPS